MRTLRAILVRLLFLPTLLWNLFFHRGVLRRRWWDEIDEHVVLGALPWRHHPKKLALLGVGAVVNTCAEYAGPCKAYEVAGIEQLRIPTVDYTPPRLEDIDRAIAFMREKAAEGRRIYVHCKAGRARSATIAMCWLIAEKGMTPEEAQRFLVERRPQVLPTIHQREVVRQFAERLAAKKA